MKTVIYARYSSDSQTENSIEGQIRECKAFAERSGMTILNTYIDRAFSAKTDNRPEFQKMIKDSAKGLFDVILVWKLDRFARNRYDSAHNKAILRKNGVKVVSATEPISEDSTGILLESLLEGYAEFYSAELSEKVIRGMTENALKCKYNGAGIPVGYYTDDEQHFHVNEATAPLVVEAFKMYADDRKSVRQIVDILNNKGLVTSLNKSMSINSVTYMLKNRKYLGEYKYRDIIVPNGIPSIVPQDLFDRVQERMAKNKKAPARTKAVQDYYLLSTKLFCGKCSAYMVGESGTSHTGKFHQYYKCVTAKKRKGCDKKAVKKAWIENLVINETFAMLNDDNVLNYITDTALDLQGRENTNLPMLREQLAETEKGIENMLNAIQSGIFNQSTKQRLDKLEQSKSDLEIKILQEEIQKPLMTREQLTFFLHKFQDIDITNQEQRQKLIDIFVNAIYLHDDKIVFVFNYKDGAKTVSLKDIRGSDLGGLGAPTTVLIGLKVQKEWLMLLLLSYNLTWISVCAGSAYGGNWVPQKDEDYKFLGELGDVNITSDGKIETKIGEDGRATIERHNTNHGFPKHHSNPHDHKIEWVEDGSPRPGPQINYWDGNVPTLKAMEGIDDMYRYIKSNSVEDNAFTSIADFQDCMRRGGEVQFTYNGKNYGVFSKVKQTSESDYQMLIGQAGNDESEAWYDNSDDLLDYIIEGKKLREIITEVAVFERTV